MRYARRDASDACDFRLEHFGQIARRSLSFDARRRRQNDLDELLFINAAQERVDSKLLRTDPVERSEQSAEDVVASTKDPRALDSEEIRCGGNYADAVFVPRWLAADATGVGFGDISANLTGMDPLVESRDRLPEGRTVFGVRVEEVEDQSSSRSATDSREASQQVDELLDRAGERHSRRTQGG